MHVTANESHGCATSGHPWGESVYGLNYKIPWNTKPDRGHQTIQEDLEQGDQNWTLSKYDLLFRDPTISTRRNLLLNISRATFNRSTRLDLQWHPYVMEQRHILQPGDLPRRVHYGQWLTNRQPRFLTDVVIGDEATFAMNAKVNTRNVRRYGPRGNPLRDWS